MDSIFGNSSMLWWGTAAAVPVIIHLLSRRRFKRVPWAAMQFLERAFKKTRKRLRIENLLLMLLRAAVLLFIAIALADPRSSSAGLFAGDGDARNTVILIDTSFSTAHRDQRDEAAFDRVRRRTLDLLEELDPQRDNVALVNYGRPARILSPFSRDLARLRETVTALEPDHVGTDLLGGLKVANGLVQELSLGAAEPGAASVWVFGDMQRKAFLGETKVSDEEGELAIEAPDPLFEKVLRDLEDARTGVFLVDAGVTEERPANVAVTDLFHRGKTLVAGIPTDFECRITNFGGATASGELRFAVDDEDAFTQREQVPDLPGRDTAAETEAETVLSFRARFDEPGWHYVSARWVSDGLEVDNVRRFAFEVRERIEVLLVDGSGAREPEDAASFFLARALDPSLGTGGGSAFSAREISALEFRTESLDDYDIVALCDVAQLDPGRIRSLEKWVEAGGALLYFAGPSLAAAGRVGRDGSTNSLLSRGGSGLLPVVFDEVLADDEFIAEPFALQFETFEHPATAYFEDPKIRQGLTDVPVWGVVQASVPKSDRNVRVLASFRRGEGATGRTHPALIEGDFGRGRVMVWTSSADTDWNLFGADRGFVPLSREVAYHLASQGRRDNIEVGATANVVFPSGVEEVRLVDGRGRESKLSTNEEEGLARLALPRSTRAGLLRLEALGTDELPERLIAVNVDPRESDLRHATSGWLLANFGSELITLVDGTDEVELIEGRATESTLWRAFLWAVLAFLVVETILAQAFGKRERAEAMA